MQLPPFLQHPRARLLAKKPIERYLLDFGRARSVLKGESQQVLPASLYRRVDCPCFEERKRQRKHLGKLKLASPKPALTDRSRNPSPPRQELRKRYRVLQPLMVLSKPATTLMIKELQSSVSATFDCSPSRLRPAVSVVLEIPHVCEEAQTERKCAWRQHRRGLSDGKFFHTDDM